MKKRREREHRLRGKVVKKKKREGTRREGIGGGPHARTHTRLVRRAHTIVKRT